MEPPNELALEAEAIEAERHHSKTQFFVVWGGLLVLTAIEVVLAYQNMQPVKMLVILMGLSLFKAALIIAYFMHLKFEVPRMKVLLMASLVICLCLMNVFFPDALRVVELGVK